MHSELIIAGCRTGLGIRVEIITSVSRQADTNPSSLHSGQGSLLIGEVPTPAT